MSPGSPVFVLSDYAVTSVTSRGTERRSIFPDESYNEHFLELFEAMGQRYSVEVHAQWLNRAANAGEWRGWWHT